MKNAKKRLLIITIAITSIIETKAQIYVDQNATGNNDGSSWANAYVELFEALEDPLLGITETELWVAGGTYKPNPIGGRNSSFHIFQNDLKIYGGFSGVETQLEQRNPGNNRTILSGDLGVVDDVTDNSYHTFFIDNVDAFLLDGVTVTSGNADGFGTNSQGGGILIISQFEFFQITIYNAFIVNNRAVNGGGIAHLNNANGYAAMPQSSLIIENAVIANNMATVYGSAILVENANTGTDGYALTSVDITFSTISDNKGNVIFASNNDFLASNDAINLNLKNSILSQNSEADFNFIGTVNSIAENCLFSDNPSGVTLTNSMTFTDPLLDSNYELMEYSPAINKGNQPYGTQTIDINGNPRIRAEIPDIGATEYKRPARLLINEFKTNVTGGCDLVELRAISSGTIDGINLRERQTTILTLPDIEVQSNDIIIVHTNEIGCSAGSGNEVNSKTEFPASTYASNYDEAYDLYTADGGLVGTDIVLSLTNSQSQFLDAVFGTNSDGTTAAANNTAASEIESASEWEIAGGGVPVGGFIDLDFELNAISDLDLAGSMQRISDVDTNTIIDWVGNAAESFGSINPGQSAIINNAPVAMDYSFNVFENISESFPLGQIPAFDPDPNDLLVFQITGGDPTSIFSISETGVLSIQPGKKLDFETATNHNLAIEISDGTNLIAVNIAVNVQDINESPIFIGGGVSDLLEDAGLQILSGWASNISDGDAGSQNLIFEYDIPDAGQFMVLPSIDQSTGDLSFNTADNFHCAVTFGVRIKDDGGTLNGGSDTSAYQIINFNVISVNDAPDFIMNTSISILEDAGLIQLPGFVSGITDGDEENQTLTFQVLASDPTLFDELPSISALSGELRFQIKQDLNGAVQIFVTLFDNGGTLNGGVNQSNTRIIDLNIEPVNDKPTFDLQGNIVLMANSPTQSYSSFVANMDDGDLEINQLMYFTIGNDNPGLFVIQPYLTTQNNLVFTPQFGMTGTAVITLQLIDNGGTANGGINTNLQTFDIIITNQNLPPSYTKGPDIVVDEDAGFMTFPNWATNISDGNGGIQNVSFIVSSNNTTLFSSQPTISPDGTLTFESKPNLSGYAQVKVIMKDDGGTVNGGIDGTKEQYFLITVNSVNDAPDFSFINFLQLQEDFEQLIYNPVEAPPPTDELTQTITYSILPDPFSIHFIDLEFDPTTGRTVINSVLDSTGQVTFRIIADDGGTENNTVEQQLFIQVLPANDPPRVANLISEFSVNQNSSSIFQIPENAFIDPEDGTNVNLNVDLDGGPLPDWIIFDASSKSIEFSPNEFVSGIYPISITATDKESESATAKIDVVVLLVTGIFDTKSKHLNLFPNPASDMINLVFEMETSGNIQLRTYQPDGKLVGSRLEYHNAGQVELNENISNLSTGTYILEVIAPNYISKTKFIKK